MSSENTFVGHLIELRQRLLYSVICVLVITIALLPFARKIYSFLAKPVLENLPEQATMIAVDITSPLMTPIKLTFLMGLFLSMPFILYQLWSFVAPGLYRREKRIAYPILISSCVLFYLGCAFAYYVVFPLAMAFISNFAPDGVTFMPDIKSYLDFMLLAFFAFGFTFEVPVIVLVLIATGVTTAEAMRRKRPYVIVGAFTIGMLITPPDIFSQTLLAIPMWVLFELGIIFSAMLKKPAEPDDSSQDHADGDHSEMT